MTSLATLSVLPLLLGVADELSVGSVVESLTGYTLPSVLMFDVREECTTTLTVEWLTVEENLLSLHLILPRF